MNEVSERNRVSEVAGSGGVDDLRKGRKRIESSRVLDSEFTTATALGLLYQSRQQEALVSTTNSGGPARH